MPWAATVGLGTSPTTTQQNRYLANTPVILNNEGEKFAVHTATGPPRNNSGWIGTFAPSTGQEAAHCAPVLAMGPQDWMVGAMLSAWVTLSFEPYAGQAPVVTAQKALNSNLDLLNDAAQRHAVARPLQPIVGQLNSSSSDLEKWVVFQSNSLLCYSIPISKIKSKRDHDLTVLVGQLSKKLFIGIE